MIKFYEKRKIFFALSAAIMIVGLVALFINGVNLSIQFKGGAIIKYSYTGEMDAEAAADKATEILNRNTEVQLTEDLATHSKKIVFNLSGNSGLDANDQDKFDAELKKAFPDAQLELSESNVVQPFIGKRFLTNGLIALGLTSLFIIIYVRFRFKKISGLSAGVIGLIALVHDVLVVFFIFVIFKMPINDSFIAVTLTIIGYSINDTIVIYDRIRENKPYFEKKTFEELVDTSINQSLSRSINTSITTGISILIVCILAFAYNIDSIKTFAIPMLVGVISGCYSTVCLAGPMLVMWHKRQQEA
ncbi:protein translocase subunit SecF [Sedimentibacter saalensis]|jgi:preprotein translocase SecF subunit|uniref:protein translocase subunit SecF n=1 Tax=Sedimentibacter saalensis TaxID=130788 RepID=UPI00289E96D9|nr:protein translocase subunit SecF [Sedimentibacter saalensis]MEA5095557.1 protein translocase subunit SecF [Sedimentibacter saalensis]